MGNCCGGVFRWKRLRRHIVLILIGLDNAGKTKTVNNLVGEKDDKVLPTVGFKAVNLIHKDTPVTIFDLGGGPQFRQIWSQYYSEVHGVIFVIDSSDFSRLEECKAVLEEVLSHDKISGKPILVLANKQDKQGALDDIDIVEKLNIEPLVNKYRCPTLVESYTASILNKSKKPKLDPGLKKGYQWLLNYIERRYGDINLRVQTDIHLDLERRKRLMERNSNRASQTFTAVSDDIATQTGFENPNYETLSRKDNLEGVILVKPTRNSHSLDTTVTIESVDDSEPNTSAKPKLSPLFGRTSDESVMSNNVELETRREFRKLSPIVKSKGIDFEKRPQSSPSTKRSKLTPSSVISTARDLSSSTASERKGTVNHVDLKDSQLVLADYEQTRGGRGNGASSDITVSQPTVSAAPRPASASQIVRRQLEVTSHKRRLSLRHIHRNKTSPEPSALFRFEPDKCPRPLRPPRRDGGDSCHNHLTPRDLTL